MAKLGEGDPRWIVSDRPDGTNINGWHWEETNKMKFCKEFFEAHCCRAQPYSEGESVDLFGEKCLKCSILSVSVEGECSISTRKKGKKFGVFDLKVTMVYEVELRVVVFKNNKGRLTPRGFNPQLSPYSPRCCPEAGGNGRRGSNFSIF